VGDYEYLNKSRREVDGVDDKEEWLALKVTVTQSLFFVADNL
jgi:myosin protein heavy chain